VRVEGLLTLFQLFLAVFAIYSALHYEEEVRLVVPLGCLILMFVVSRIDKKLSDSESARKSFLKTEIDKVWKKKSPTVIEQDFSAIESLVWPKSELLLIDAVHSMFKDLGFKITTGINYHSVDRIVRIPDTGMVFGVEIMMSEGEVEENHPKLTRALQFEKEKREDEKTLIIGSTHTRLPLSERDKVHDVSRELADFLERHNISFMTTHHLYELWQKSKAGKVDIFGLFASVYSHRGGVFPLEDVTDSYPFSPNP
jgi:hypothetical protein